MMITIVDATLLVASAVVIVVTGQMSRVKTRVLPGAIVFVRTESVLS